MTKQKLDTEQLKQKAFDGLGRLKKYNFILFIFLVVLLYGSVLYKIQSLKSAQPSPDSVSTQVKAAKVPKINEDVIRQLQTLHDNSVSVQTLFDTERSNPFKE